jgi:hypothetical protein
MGHQTTVEEMRAEKADKYNELKDNKKSKEYEEWFLRYRPTDNKNINENKKTKKNNKKTRQKINKNKKTKKRKGFFF